MRQESRNPNTHPPTPTHQQGQKSNTTAMAEQGRTGSRRQQVPVSQQGGSDYGNQAGRGAGPGAGAGTGGGGGGGGAAGGMGERDSARGGGRGGVEREREREVKYVVYLKLPFGREGFVDPPQVGGIAIV